MSIIESHPENFAARRTAILATMEKYPQLRQQFLDKLTAKLANGTTPANPLHQDAVLQDAALMLERMETRQRRTTALEELPDRLLLALETAGRGEPKRHGR